MAAAVLSPLFGVTSYLLCGRAFPALTASTPFPPASCPPTAAKATAKVTDDLLIARSDRHLGALTAVALCVASDGLTPPASRGLELAPLWAPDLLGSPSQRLRRVPGTLAAGSPGDALSHSFIPHKARGTGSVL